MTGRVWLKKTATVNGWWKPYQRDTNEKSKRVKKKDIGRHNKVQKQKETWYINGDWNENTYTKKDRFMLERTD